jgi:hypothetical protein
VLGLSARITLEPADTLDEGDTLRAQIMRPGMVAIPLP